MENTIYNIILADKTKIHATLNGNNCTADDLDNMKIKSIESIIKKMT